MNVYRSHDIPMSCLLFQGFNGFNRLNTAERYDPEEPGPWRMIPDMSSARSNFAAVCADELLICIGGFNGELFGRQRHDG